MLGSARNPAQPQHLFLLPRQGAEQFGSQRCPRRAARSPLGALPLVQELEEVRVLAVLPRPGLHTREGQDHCCSLAISPPAAPARRPRRQDVCGHHGRDRSLPLPPRSFSHFASFSPA